MSAVIAIVLGVITGYAVHINHGPGWAAVGFGLTVLNIGLAGDRVVAAIRRSRTPAGPK